MRGSEKLGGVEMVKSFPTYTLEPSCSVPVKGDGPPDYF